MLSLNLLYNYVSFFKVKGVAHRAMDVLPAEVFESVLLFLSGVDLLSLRLIHSFFNDCVLNVFRWRESERLDGHHAERVKWLESRAAYRAMRNVAQAPAPSFSALIDYPDELMWLPAPAAEPWPPGFTLEEMTDEGNLPSILLYSHRHRGWSSEAENRAKFLSMVRMMSYSSPGYLQNFLHCEDGDMHNLPLTWLHVKPGTTNGVVPPREDVISLIYLCLFASSSFHSWRAVGNALLKSPVVKREFLRVTAEILTQLMLEDDYCEDGHYFASNPEIEPAVWVARVVVFAPEIVILNPQTTRAMLKRSAFSQCNSIPSVFFCSSRARAVLCSLIRLFPDCVGAEFACKFVFELVSKCEVKVVHALLESHGDDIRALRREKNETVLFAAYTSRHIAHKLVHLLLKFGVDPNVRNSEGFLAKDLASKRLLKKLPT